VPSESDVPADAAPTTPMPVGPPRRPGSRAGTVGVTIVLALAGLLFTTSATTSHGTQLRSQRSDLADLLAAEDLRVQTRTQRFDAMRRDVDAQTRAQNANNEAIAALEKSSAAVVARAGLTAVAGPGLIVTLDDAPRDAPVPARAGPDDLVVHQQDVQAVVNALWAGGAEAMMLQDQRVISTSAVRCVGNTLILQGRVYSPPYTIRAIGNVKNMQDAIGSSPTIAYYLQYVATMRLGWSVEKRDRLTMPAYSGSLALTHARVAGRPDDPTPSGSSPGVTSDQEATP
jgi:uncharacterized protein YlxW (UPF0749 family)